MKRKKERYVIEFSKLVKKVRKVDYFFYQDDKSINLWWHLGEYPMIDLRKDGQSGYIQYDTQYEKLFNVPLPILIMLVTELAKREKIKI